MIISQTAHALDPMIQWLTFATLIVGFVTIAVQLGRKTRDIEANAEQLERLRVIVEEMARTFTALAQTSARDFGRIEAEMRALERRVEMLEESEISERNGRQR